MGRKTECRSPLTDSEWKARTRNHGSVEDSDEKTAKIVYSKQSILKCRTSDVFRKLKVEQPKLNCILKGGGAMTKIRKVLGGVSFIGVLLLNQPMTWGQGFADQIEGQATHCGKPWTISILGTPANDYLADFKTAFVCPISGTNKTQSFAMMASAGVGTGLGVFGSSTAVGPGAADGTDQQTNDTLVLHPPPGFTGTSVEIGLKETYTLIVQGANARNRGSATVCFRWTGQQTHVASPINQRECYQNVEGSQDCGQEDGSRF